MTGPTYESLRVGDLALVNGPLVRVVALSTARNGVAGAVVRDDTGLEAWVALRWLLPVPMEKGNK